MDVTLYEGRNNPAMGYQAKTPDRIWWSDETRWFVLNALPGDTNVAGSGAARRAEVTVTLDDTNAREGVTQVWTFKISGIHPYTPTGVWGARHQWHGPNDTGQAQVFWHTEGGVWKVRLWDAGTQRELTTVTLLDWTDQPINYVVDEVLDVVELVTWSSDPSFGRYKLWVNGRVQVDRRFQTLHVRTKGGVLIPSSQRRNAFKAGIYTNDSNPAVIGTGIKDIRRIQNGTEEEMLALALNTPVENPCSEVEAQLAAVTAERDAAREVALNLKARLDSIVQIAVGA